MKSRVDGLKALREIPKICGMRRERICGMRSLEKIQLYPREWMGITEFCTLSTRVVSKSDPPLLAMKR